MHRRRRWPGHPAAVPAGAQGRSAGIYPHVSGQERGVEMKMAWLILALAAGCFAQSGSYIPPRTSDGLPDLEGIWQPRANSAMYSVLPHPGGFFLGAGSKEGVVDGGVLPYQPWAAARVKE